MSEKTKEEIKPADNWEESRDKLFARIPPYCTGIFFTAFNIQSGSLLIAPCYCKDLFTERLTHVLKKNMRKNIAIGLVVASSQRPKKQHLLNRIELFMKFLHSIEKTWNVRRYSKQLFIESRYNGRVHLIVIHPSYPWLYSTIFTHAFLLLFRVSFSKTRNSVKDLLGKVEFSPDFIGELFTKLASASDYPMRKYRTRIYKVLSNVDKFKDAKSNRLKHMKYPHHGICRAVHS
jgi:hypothetical protein